MINKSNLPDEYVVPLATNKPRTKQRGFCSIDRRQNV